MDNIEEKLRTINVTLGEQKIPLRINKDDEWLYRDAEKLLKNGFAQTQKIHPNKLGEEYLTLLAYYFAIELVKKHHQEEDNVLVSKMDELSNEIDEIFAD
jgi:hypothetical protein